MRTYLIYKEKARRWNEDTEIQALVKEVSDGPGRRRCRRWAATARPRRKSSRRHSFDRKALGARGLNYERLDQLTLEVILGVRG